MLYDEVQLSKKHTQSLLIPAFVDNSNDIAWLHEIDNNLSSLAGYFARLNTITAEQGLSESKASRYYALALNIEDPANQQIIEFPWYNNFSDMQPFFDWLTSSDERYFDTDQSWQFLAQRKGDLIILTESFAEPETEGFITITDDATVVTVDQQTIKTAIKQTIRQFKQVIRQLELQLGNNYWL